MTFQNLCVIAHLDGILHPEERNMLMEIAEGMGLPEAQTSRLLNQGSRLEFVIPPTEGERFIELRMVVLMMLTDGRMDEREYEGCKQLAELMGIEQPYLDEVVAFYQEKQQQRLQQLGIFQNLYLVAVADGYIDPQEQQLLLDVARTLGLSQRDVDQVLESEKPLDFVIPDDEEDRFFALKNLVYMMVVDGKVAPEEYSLCVEFAEQIGLGKDEVNQIVSDYETLQTERKNQEDEVLERNTDVYLDLFNEFYQIEFPPEEWLRHIQRAEQVGDSEAPEDFNPEEKLVFYRLMWLIYVRSYQLSDEAEMMVPLYLDLSKAKANLQDLFDFLLDHERTHGAEAIDFIQLSLEQLKQELRAQLGSFIR